MDPAQRGQVPGFLYRWFFFLALMQFSLLMVLAWWGPGSARKAVPFEADQPVVCEDFKQPSHLPLNFPMFTLHCEGESCLHSRYVQPEAGSPDFETHIVAVEGESPRPRSAAWPHITVRLQPSDKPIRLVLVSKESVQWDLKGAEPELLKDVHVVTPQGARISGMTDAEEVPLYWHGQSTLCLHPHSWWDHDNPNNEFQRFLTHVRTLLGAPEDSFQGSLRGKIFEVPFYDSREDEARHVLGFRKKWLPADRGPASEQGLFSEGPIYELHHHVLRDLGWGKVHRASRQTELMEPIPEDRTFLARRPDGKFHLLTDGARLLLYSGALQQELAIAPPEGIADFRRLRLASFAEDQQSVVFEQKGLTLVPLQHKACASLA